jgi:hypothetical protein
LTAQYRTAAHSKRFAGNVRGGLADEEDDGVSHFLRLSGAVIVVCCRFK